MLNWGRYKHVLVHPDFWHMLGIHVGEGQDREVYAETTLPFGHRLAPKIFTAFSDALVWIARKFGTERLKYMDDFAAAQPAGSGLCQHDLNAIRAACGLTGFEIQEEKVEGPETCLPVLGVEVDTITWEVRIGEKKLQSLRTDLQQWSQKSSALKHEIASIHGHLSFVAQVAKPGQIFLWHMVDEMKVSDMDARISLSADFMAEVHWWCDLLPE